MRTSRRPFARLVAALLLAAAASGPAQGSDEPPQTSFTSSTWQRFTATVDEVYLQPHHLSVADLSPRQLAKVLGHAIGRQAHYVGDDAERRAAFEALRAAARSALEDGLAYLGWLAGEDPRAAGSDELVSAFTDAAQGFYDDEILELTGVGPDAIVPSVLSGDTTLSDSPPPLPRLRPVEPRAATERHRCRFYVDPALYTDTKSDFSWALVRRPWRGGFYYETWPIDPDWESDHPKQPAHRLREEQEIVLIGSKSDVLRLVEQLRSGCS